jgi:ATP-dependent Clp protease ATP-binding subunit ClpA
MCIDKYAQKMQEALQAAQDLASRGNHPEITNERFLSALLDQSETATRRWLRST